jgi:FtsZ-binding cell division protein ZapB
VDLESTREEVKLLRQEQIDMTNKIEEKEQENAQLRNHLDQLQGKRKSLL